MSNETKKANLRRAKDNLFVKEVFVGDGFDVGCGQDKLDICPEFPNIKSVKGFDKKDGNAQHILKYEEREYDFVYSSHCLEHMLDPGLALFNWSCLVKRDGYLIIIIPDEDLYEQGTFPSINNKDHKYTFSIDKFKSWSPVSINIDELIQHALPNWRVIKMEVESTGYDFNRQGSGVDQTREGAEANIEVVLKNV